MNVQGYRGTLRIVNVTCVDLDSFALILHCFNQSSIKCRCNCNFFDATAGSESDTRTAVSFANVAVLAFFDVGSKCCKYRVDRG